MMKNWMDLVYPRLCYNCNEKLEEREEYVCGKCWCELPIHPESQWNRHLVFETTENGFTDGIITGGLYQDSLKNLIWQWKYGKNIILTDLFVEIILWQYKKQSFDAIPDYITYIPSSMVKEVKRGYNPPQVLAQNLAKKLELPCINLLSKRKSHSQTNLSRKARKENQGVFELSHNAKQISGKNIILVDDVITTGATLNECAYLLKKRRNAEKVFAVTVARTTANPVICT